MLPPSCNRLIGLAIATFTLIFLIFIALHQGGGSIKTIKDAAKSAASSAQNAAVCATKPAPQQQEQQQ
jgi:hypothetical protein